jgi:hypothetical protein
MAFQDFKKGTKTHFIKNMWYFIENEDGKTLLKYTHGLLTNKYYYFEDVNGTNLRLDIFYLNNTRIEYIGNNKEVREKYPQYFI